MSIPIKITPEIQNELTFLQTVNATCVQHGYKMSKFNIISEVAEEIVALDTRGYVTNTNGIVDVVTADNTTVQVKSCNEARDEVTINYTEDKPVDLMAIVEFSKNYDSVRYLYIGSFKQFIETAQDNMKQRGIWDNHRTLKKTYVAELQEKFGLRNNDEDDGLSKSKLDDFI